MLAVLVYKKHICFILIVFVWAHDSKCTKRNLWTVRASQLIFLPCSEWADVSLGTVILGLTFPDLLQKWNPLWKKRSSALDSKRHSKSVQLPLWKRFFITTGWNISLWKNEAAILKPTGDFGYKKLYVELIGCSQSAPIQRNCSCSFGLQRWPECSSLKE